MSNVASNPEFYETVPVICGLEYYKVLSCCFLLLHLSLFSFHSSFAQQPPAWLDFSQRRNIYLESLYFNGFGMIPVGKHDNVEEKLKTAESDARRLLIESIKVTVQSTSAYIVGENNRKIAEEFRQSVASFSDATLTGFKIEPYFDRKHKVACAFAWVNKQALNDDYQKLYHLHRSQVESMLNEAGRFYSNGQKLKALDIYNNCFPLVRQMEADLVMLVTTGNYPEGKSPGDYEEMINSGLSEIRQNNNLDPDDICQLLAGSLKKQLGDPAQMIRIVPFTYRESKLTSEFSGWIFPIFEHKLKEEGINISTMAKQSGDSEFLLSGTYWEEGDYLKCIVLIKNTGNGKTIASAENRMPKSRIETKSISFKPENFEDAMIRQKIMAKDEIIGGGLLLDVWTNKGDENLLFSEGETMKISIRVNHECYLRFIYYFADGTRTLLDEYYLGSNQVNKVVTLPSDYRCFPPFGAEMLQVVAQNEQFQPLRLKEEDGYKIILDGTQAIVNNSRGFKKDSDQKLYAEKRCTITTTKKY